MSVSPTVSFRPSLRLIRRPSGSQARIVTAVLMSCLLCAAIVLALAATAAATAHNMPRQFSKFCGVSDIPHSFDHLRDIFRIGIRRNAVTQIKDMWSIGQCFDDAFAFIF